jgi:hypothetical protein
MLLHQMKMTDAKLSVIPGPICGAWTTGITRRRTKPVQGMFARCGTHPCRSGKPPGKTAQWGRDFSQTAALAAPIPRRSSMDALLVAADSALRTLFVNPRASRACPTLPETPGSAELQQEEQRLSAALMRVNHVGEVCAQALYTAQALAARSGRRPNEPLARQL